MILKKVCTASEFLSPFRVYLSMPVLYSAILKDASLIFACLYIQLLRAAPTLYIQVGNGIALAWQETLSIQVSLALCAMT